MNKWAKLATAEENPDKVGKFKCKHIRGEQKALKSWKRLFKKDFLTKALTGHWYTYHIYLEARCKIVKGDGFETAKWFRKVIVGLLLVPD